MSDSASPNNTSNGGASSWWQRTSLKQVALGTAIVALTITAGGVLIALRYVLLLLFLGIVVATALGPLAERLRNAGVSRGAAAVSAFLIFIAGVAAIIGALVPFFIDQISTVTIDLPERYASLRGTLEDSPSRLVRELAGQMPSDPFTSINSENGVALGAQVAALLPGLVRGIAFGALVLLLSYYWLYYRALAIQSVALLLPIDWRGEAVELWNQIEAKIGGFVRGLAVLGLSIAILSFIGYSVAGVPYALTLGIIAGILEAVPYVGPFLTLLIATLVGLSVSPTLGLLAFVVANIVQLLENTIVVPRAMGKTVGVNPVVTLLALAIFSELFGLLGALLAVPLAAAFQVLLDRFVLSAPDPSQLEIGGRDQLALLRYKTQDLATDLRQQVRSKEAEVTPEIDADEEELEALLVDLDGLLAAAQEQRA